MEIENENCHNDWKSHHHHDTCKVRPWKEKEKEDNIEGEMYE